MLFSKSLLDSKLAELRPKLGVLSGCGSQLPCQNKLLHGKVAISHGLLDCLLKLKKFLWGLTKG